MVLPADLLPEVVVLGAAAVDQIAQVPTLPQPDEIVLADSVQRFAGGSGGNVACGVARLGRRVCFLGKVGDDAEGSWLLRAFADENVDTQGVRVQQGARTASCFIAVDRQGQRVIYALGGAAILERPAELDLALISSARLLFIADALSEVAEAACQAARSSRVPVLFAPGGLMAAAGHGFLEPILAQTEVLIVSHAEANRLAGESQASLAAKKLARWGPRVVMITLGHDGAMLYRPPTYTHIPAYPVDKIYDTTGAGDAFAAGVIGGYLDGLDWVGAAHLGCALAAAKVEHLGPRGGTLQPEQIARLYQELEREGYLR